MHIHASSMNFNGANLHNAAAADKAASAQRASDVRKKLLKSGMDMDAGLDPEASFLIGRWPEGDSRQGQGQNQGQRRTSTPVKTQLTNEQQTDAHITVWG